MHSILQDTITIVSDFIFPKHCVGCYVEGEFLCDSCLWGLGHVMQEQVCIACHKPSLFGITHPGCSTPHGADGLVAIFDYRHAYVKDAIVLGKYKFVAEVFQILGRRASALLHEHAYAPFFESFTLVPLPLARSRLNFRGFNQSRVLADELALSLGIPVKELLIRTKSTKIQKDLKLEDRKLNMQDAFSLSPETKGTLRNQNFLIVDDVTTSGTTLHEAAQVLKRNSAAKVFCLALATERANNYSNSTLP